MDEGLQVRLKSANGVIFASTMNIFRLRLAHVGRNYPCLKDPTYGFKSSQNSSAIEYYTRKRVWGRGGHIDFDMISNWGKKKEQALL